MPKESSPPRSIKIRSRHFWADVHRRKLARQQRQQRPQHSIHEDSHHTIGYEQNPIYTFTPRRDTPLVTTFLADGTAVTTGLDGPVRPKPAAAPPIALPADVMRYRARGQALRDAQISADEKLLALLKEGPEGRRKRRRSFMQTHPNPYHCDVPLRLDPKEKEDKSLPRYLLVGQPCGLAGAYQSWPTADSLQKANPKMTLKRYETWDNERLESAWHAACERGDHDWHPGVPKVSATPSRPTAHTPSTPTSSRRVPPAHQSAPSTPSSRRHREGQQAPILMSPRTHRSPSPTPARVSSPPVMAVRIAPGVGDIFHDVEEAQEEYHKQVRQGKSPVLAVRGSLSAAMAFVGGTVEWGSDSEVDASPFE
ncbi:hypothetical protein FB45DRAFT_1038332 [Roridomyces roridus]|uniref:Uncharacterized protein n=1 Tax=Roridomyces roridus TaxID=1738132 RepID=A0AAD7FBC9_9AGAR|nr:hypothetical protein FB45DRAFT_1038332 [Roridomyces roridus]